MGNYEQLKQSVSDVIKTNGNQEITGSILQNVLLTIISTVGANATFAGIATPTTNPGTPDGPVFYLASESGTYTNFGSIELQAGLSVLMWNGTWNSQQVFGVDDVPTVGSDNLVKSGGVYAKIKAIEDAGYVFAGIATPTTNPGTPDGPVFWIAGQGGQYTNFGGIELQDGLSVLMWNGSWSTQPILSIDDVPTAGSDNLVKSGGVQEELALGSVYDVSAKNPTAGVNNDGKWESLSALLSDANLNTLIPTPVRKGGMSIKFVQSSDNKYVQYRLTKNVWSFDTANWQGVDNEAVESSSNLMTSGGGWNLLKKTKYLFSPIWRDDRRLFFDETDSCIKIIGKKTAMDNKLLSFFFEGIRYDINDTITTKQLNFSIISNAGLFLPKAQNDVIYSLNDIVKFEDNEEHNGYVKLCHILFAKEFCGDLFLNTQNISSFNIFDGNISTILKDGVYKYITDTNTSVLLLVSSNGTRQQRVWADGNNHIQVRTFSNNAWSDWKDYDTDINQNIEQLNKKTRILNLDIEILNPDFNYASVVRSNKSIKADGIEETYNGRDTFYYKLPNKGETPKIKGCAIAAYQWYSSYPDYINGSNSLGRSTTAPAEALYGGITIDASYSYSNITVRSPQYNNEQTKKDINLYSSNLNNSVGENCFANGVRNNLKILGYGNSFMRNTVHYLSAIAKGCGVNLTVGNLYTGGTNLDDHYAALLNGTSPYEWHKYVDGTNTVNEVNQTALRGLLDERWDAIILHQYTPWSEPFEPIFNQFIKLIIEKIGYCPKIYINATWAGHEDYVEQQYGFETEEAMWEYMLNACKGACADSGVAEFSIIPTGTAIQNARTLSWADDYNRFVNGGTDWHHLNPAGGFIAACTVFQKIIAPLNGIPCSNTTFRIISATSLPPQTNIEQGILVTDDNYLPMCQAATAAVNNPNVITTITESE